MPEKIDAFEFDRRRSHKSKWDKWFTGEIFRFAKGTDFESNPEPFRAAVVAAARRRGLKVRTKIDGDTVTIQSYKADDA